MKVRKHTKTCKQKVWGKYEIMYELFACFLQILANFNSNLHKNRTKLLAETYEYAQKIERNTTKTPNIPFAESGL